MRRSSEKEGDRFLVSKINYSNLTIVKVRKVEMMTELRTTKIFIRLLTSEDLKKVFVCL